MAMSLTSRLKRLLGARPDVPADAPTVEGFVGDADSTGLNFRIAKADLTALQRGEAGGAAREQLVALDLLAEQGIATPLANGYRLSSFDATRLDREIADILDLPPRFPGEFHAHVWGNTTSSRFSVTPTLVLDGISAPIDRTGPLVDVGGQVYLLSPSALAAIDALDFHDSLPVDARTERANVELVALLQDARTLASSHEAELSDPGFVPTLAQFDNLSTARPSKVGLIAEQQDDGSLLLSPDLGVDASAEAFIRRRHQLESGNVVRIDDQLILLTDPQRAAVAEVIDKSHIPASHVKEFLRAPGDYFESDDVDVDISFGIRVEGIGLVVPMTFHEASESGIDWLATVDRLISPAALAESIVEQPELADVREKVAAARESGASTITVDDRVVDISDHDLVDEELEKAAARLEAQQPSVPSTPPSDLTVGMFIVESTDRGDVLRGLAATAARDHAPDLTGLRYAPYSHQEEGIKWISGLMRASLASPTEGPRIQGGLLADDMGLGKTFMTLAAVRDFNKQQVSTHGSAKPTLAVLPLSLIENWESEIEQFFEESPFSDIVVLQTDRDLSHFRRAGRSRETQIGESDLDESGMVKEEALRLSLRVGSAHGNHRLDTPGRLVIATYQTLSSYQLSLGQVEWGAVVFDEAQTIKNPETLASRAAKGLKADFKLLATGTPVENSLKDLWNLMDTAQPDLLGSWQQFRSTWVPSTDESSDRVLERGKDLRDEVGSFMLRRTKESVLSGLPTKTLHVGWTEEAPGDDAGIRLDERLAVTMPEPQRVAYDHVLDSHSSAKGGALKTLQRLRSVSLHPEVGAERFEHVDSNDSARLIATFEVLDAVRRTGEKAIVFVIDKRMQLKLARWLGDRYSIPVKIVNGDTSAVAGRSSRNGTGTRKSIIAEFESVDGFNVIVMSPLAVGTGLTIVGANHAIHLERHWNPAKEAQATDRIYRIGQTKPVHVYLPLALHPDVTSFDLNLDALLRSKTDLKDAIVVPGRIEDELADRLLINDG